MMINDTYYDITELTPGTDYTVTVAAINMAGVGVAGTAMFYIVTMTEAIPSGEFKFSMCIYYCLQSQFIKTHGSESRGQEEAACMCVVWPTRPLQ